MSHRKRSAPSSCYSVIKEISASFETMHRVATLTWFFQLLVDCDFEQRMFILQPTFLTEICVKLYAVTCFGKKLLVAFCLVCKLLVVSTK